MYKTLSSLLLHKAYSFQKSCYFGSSRKSYCETQKTVNTRNINGMLLCCKEKANQAWKTKPQTATVISLWFWGLLACPELYFDWALDNQHSWNISGVHGFLSLIVMLSQFSRMKRRFTRRLSEENLQKKTLLLAFLACFIQLKKWTPRHKFSRLLILSLRLHQNEMSSWFIIKKNLIKQLFHSPLLDTSG